MSFAIVQKNLWPAFGATVGLGMKASAVGLTVFMLAFIAERERFQATARSVVRQSAADRVAWAALRALGERIAPAPVSRVENFGQAMAAYRRIVPDDRRRPACVMIDDSKFVACAAGFRSCGSGMRDGVYERERRRFVLQACGELANLFRCATNFDFNVASVVAYPADQMQFVGQPPDKRAKADALNDAADADVLANHDTKLSCGSMFLQGVGRAILPGFFGLRVPNKTRKDVVG